MIVSYILFLTFTISSAQWLFPRTCSKCICASNLDLDLIPATPAGTNIDTGAFCNNITATTTNCYIGPRGSLSDRSCILISGGKTLREALSKATYMGIPIWGDDKDSLAIMETHPHVTAGILRLALTMPPKFLTSVPKSDTSLDQIEVALKKSVGEIADALNKSLAAMSSADRALTSSIDTATKLVTVNRTVYNNVETTERVRREVTLVSHTVENVTRVVTETPQLGTVPYLDKFFSGINSTNASNAFLGYLNVILSRVELAVNQHFYALVENGNTHKDLDSVTRYFNLVALAVTIIAALVSAIIGLPRAFRCLKMLIKGIFATPVSKAEAFAAALRSTKNMPMTLVDEDFIGVQLNGLDAIYDSVVGMVTTYYVAIMAQIETMVGDTVVTVDHAYMRIGQLTTERPICPTNNTFNISTKDWPEMAFRLHDGLPKADADPTKESTASKLVRRNLHVLSCNGRGLAMLERALAHVFSDKYNRSVLCMKSNAFLRLSGVSIPGATSMLVRPVAIVVYGPNLITLRAFRITDIGDRPISGHEAFHRFGPSYQVVRAAYKRGAVPHKSDEKRDKEGSKLLKEELKKTNEKGLDTKAVPVISLDLTPI